MREKGMPLAIFLFVATCLSTLFVGCMWEGVDLSKEGFTSLWRGYTFALPLMSILLSHELGHYFAARIHRVDVSPPYFIPIPFTLIGTFGAVIKMREQIERRDALLDIGAAGPLVGFVVTVPILLYGIATSPVQALDPAVTYLVEGKSLFYLGILYALKGPIPEGYDVLLTPTALAGWTGLLVTMLNLVPVAQLDGGHVAYALFGERQDRYSRRFLRALLVLAILISAVSLGRAAMLGEGEQGLATAATAGLNWGIWWLLLSAMSRANDGRHPTTRPGPLSPKRRIIAIATLLLFPLLFMPTWISES